MEKRQEKYYLYLRWPRYLAQWFAHEMHRLRNYENKTLPPFRYECGVEPDKLDVVVTRRGSIENLILEQCLAKQPDPVPFLIRFMCHTCDPAFAVQMSHFTIVQPTGRQV